VSITGSNGQGEEIPLTGISSAGWPAIVLQPGATGLDMPPVELHSDDSPNLDGAIYRGSRATSRLVLLPLYVYGIDRSSLRKFKRKLADALNPKNGPCILKFQESHGSPRTLTCYYTAGMEGDESSDASGFTWTSYGIQLTAFDPWFYGQTAVGQSWEFGTEVPFLASPFLPLTLSSGTPVSGAATVTNNGDIEAWPIWTVAGPVRSIAMTGPDGSSWAIPANTSGTDVVPAGRTLTVDTRPGFKTLMDDQGTNYWPQLGPNPSLWSIPEGTSQVQINAVAGDGQASVTMTLNPRYSTY
jgi:hypothetical protein